MWIYTSKGFVSAVKNRNEHGLVVRARDKESLDYLAALAEVQVMKSPKADYPYRVFVDNDTFTKWISSHIEGMDYTNFKSKVARTRGPEYSQALHAVWAVMHDVEDSDARSGLRSGYIQRPQETDRGQNHA